MDRTPQPVLRVDDVHKDFGRGSKRKKVLKGLSFEVPENRVVSLLGANGAGKTTLVNIASTLMLPTSGTIEVCGTNVVTHPEQARRSISLTGQFAAVDGELTGRENWSSSLACTGCGPRRPGHGPTSCWNSSGFPPPPPNGPPSIREACGAASTSPPR